MSTSMLTRAQIEWSNVAVGAAVSLFEVYAPPPTSRSDMAGLRSDSRSRSPRRKRVRSPTLELTAQMAANRGQSLRTALSTIYSVLHSAQPPTDRAERRCQGLLACAELAPTRLMRQAG